jgi:SAM-dependent methyltransferase
MGLFSQLAVLLLREHRHRPITGSILSIGRQTIFFSPEQAAALVERELGAAAVRRTDLEIDTQTRGSGRGRFVTDRSFYSLFSEADYKCLDVSGYEGADLVADLCQPLPASIDARFDFIIDGSTLDNVFDPATAIRNLTRLLKPGGRIFQTNHAARRHNVYVGFSLSWFHDYYAINDFADCQVYLAQYEEPRTENRWDFYHYEPMRDDGSRVSYFGQDSYYYPWREAMAVVIAEKGAHSTWARTPIQFEYRDTIRFENRDGRREIVRQTTADDAADPYVAAALRFYRSKRPLCLAPAEKVMLPDKYYYYSPETVYCGSLFPIEQHLGAKERRPA